MSPGSVWPYTLELPVLAAAAGEAVCDRVATGALGSAGELAAPTVQPLTTTMTADASSALIKTVGRVRSRTRPSVLCRNYASSCEFLDPIMRPTCASQRTVRSSRLLGRAKPRGEG